jgi:hypothetical protein
MHVTTLAVVNQCHHPAQSPVPMHLAPEKSQSPGASPSLLLSQVYWEPWQSLCMHWLLRLDPVPSQLKHALGASGSLKGPESRRLGQVHPLWCAKGHI